MALTGARVVPRLPGVPRRRTARRSATRACPGAIAGAAACPVAHGPARPRHRRAAAPHRRRRSPRWWPCCSSSRLLLRAGAARRPGGRRHEVRADGRRPGDVRRGRRRRPVRDAVARGLGGSCLVGLVAAALASPAACAAAPAGRLTWPAVNGVWAARLRGIPGGSTPRSPRCWPLTHRRRRRWRGAGAAGLAWFAAVARCRWSWRRRAPVAVVLGGAVGWRSSAVAVGVRVEGPYPELVVAVAVYTAARYGPRRQLVPIVVGDRGAGRHRVHRRTVRRWTTFGVRLAAARGDRAARARDHAPGRPTSAAAGGAGRRGWSANATSRPGSPPPPSGPASPGTCTTSSRTTSP